MWDEREAAHCTRAVVGLSTARPRANACSRCDSRRRRLWITAMNFL